MRAILLSTIAVVAFTGAAAAADLPTHKEAPAPYVAPPIFTWTGFYVGLNAGGSWGGSSTDVTTVPGFINAAVLSPTGIAHATDYATGANAGLPVRNTGFAGGAQVGYNWQFSSFVAGLETDIQGFSGAKSSGSVTNLAQTALGESPVSVTVSGGSKIDYLGTLRGRVGYLLTPSLLGYATGGLAYGGVQSHASIFGFETVPSGIGNAFTSGSFSTTRVGWTLGAGVEWMFWQNWSVKGEYLYYDLGRATNALPPFTAPIAGVQAFSHTPILSTRYDGNLARVGLNYHF
jgi:outer membrane immunogenic protein